jgi:hypothetical protein
MELSKNVYNDKLNIATKIHLHRKKKKISASKTSYLMCSQLLEGLKCESKLKTTKE